VQEFAEYEYDMHRNGRLKHLIFGSQLNTKLLAKLFRSADMIRQLSRDPEGNRRLRELLAHRRAMLYFTQPSTRTFLSFMAACQILGITCNEVRDPKTSSEVKRESKLDSIRMYVIIMRSQNYAECCAYLMNDLERNQHRSVPIINAGAGSDEHPTQALLDAYTITRTFDFDETSLKHDSRLNELCAKYPNLTPGMDNKTYAFCGDIGRGRTVPNVRMFFVSPDQAALKIDDQLKQRLIRAGVQVLEFDSLDATHNGQPLLSQIDCMYMTRIQREQTDD